MDLYIMNLGQAKAEMQEFVKAKYNIDIFMQVDEQQKQEQKKQKIKQHRDSIWGNHQIFSLVVALFFTLSGSRIFL